MQALSQLIQCNQKYNVIFFLLINFSSLQKSKNHQEDKAKFDSKLRWLFDGDDELCLGRHRNTSYLIHCDLLIEPLIPWSNESFIQSFSQCVFPKFDSRVENVRRSVSSETLAKKVKEAISL